MANLVSISVYKINQSAPLTSAQIIAFPTAGAVLVRDVSGSATRDLGNGVNVYSAVQLIANGTLYYCRETQAAMVTLFG